MQRDRTLDLNAIDGFAEVLGALSFVKPDVLVVAIDHPTARHAADLAALVRAAAPPILVFSNPAVGRAVTDVIKTGIGGYLFTGDALRLCDSVRELLRGGVPMSHAYLSSSLAAPAAARVKCVR